MINVSVAVSGNPHEFFVELVQSHLPELQVQYGFGLKTDSKSIYHLHFYLVNCCGTQIVHKV